MSESKIYHVTGFIQMWINQTIEATSKEDAIEKISNENPDFECDELEAEEIDY